MSSKTISAHKTLLKLKTIVLLYWTISSQYSSILSSTIICTLLSTREKLKNIINTKLYPIIVRLCFFQGYNHFFFLFIFIIVERNRAIIWTLEMSHKTRYESQFDIHYIFYYFTLQIVYPIISQISLRDSIKLSLFPFLFPIVERNHIII